MIVEGVTFIEPAVKRMKKQDFIKAHKDAYWQDREPKEREKMLSDTYDTICGSRGKGSEKPGSVEVTE